MKWWSWFGGGELSDPPMYTCTVTPGRMQADEYAEFVQTMSDDELYAMWNLVCDEAEQRGMESET